MELYIYICVQCTIYTVHTKTGWDAVRGAFWCGQKIAALPLQCSQYLFYVMLHFFLTFATFLLDFLHFSYTYYNVSMFVEVKFAEKSWIRIERDISRAERMFSPYLDHQRSPAGEPIITTPEPPSYSPSTESPVRYITKPTQTDTHYHHHQLHHQQHKNSQVVQQAIFSDRVSLCPFVSIVELLFQFSAIASPSSYPCQWVSLCVSAVFKFLWNLQEAQCVVLSYSLLLSVTPHGWGHAMHQRNVFSATSTSAKRLRRWPSPKL